MESGSTVAIVLRDVMDKDLSVFFEQGQDRASIQMAAFTCKDPADRKAFDAHWKKIRGKDSVTIKTILFEGRVAGHLAKFEMLGKPEVTYWIGREYWGKGIATQSLIEFLEDLDVRPLYARVVKDNVASLRVLEKCGFAITGEEKGFAEGRGQEVEEFILELK